MEASCLIAEIYGGHGPTGRFAVATLVAVVDYGGNEYGRARTVRGLRRVRNRMRIPTQIRVIRFGAEVAPTDYLPEQVV